MKNPLPIGFGARLKELIAEGLPAKEAMKEVWREVKKSRARTGTYSGSREIFGRKRRKNPIMSDDNPIIMSSKSQAEFYVNVLNEKFSVYPYTHISISTLGGEARVSILITISLTPKSEWPNSILENSKYAKFHLGYDGKLELITGYGVGKMRKVTVKNISDAAIKIFRFLGYPQKNPYRKKRKPLRRSGQGQAGFKFLRKARENPIAIYNPPKKQKLLYGRAFIPVIRGIKTNGKYRGERYEHKFSKNEVSIYGNPDGSLIIKSNNNLRLWNYDKDI